MLEKLSLLWKGEAPLRNEYKEFVNMLEKARVMYQMIADALRSGEVDEDLETTIYSQDIEINKLERKIRKALVTQLAMNPGSEITGSLVLMSIVKDAERLGDFCKNLFEASTYWAISCSEMYYADRLNEFMNYVAETFNSTIKAFNHEDDVLAAEIIQDEIKWNKRFDQFIAEMAESDLTTKEAVCSVLMARALKRLQAHLSNIASSVVLPVHHIDQRPKHLR